MYTYMYIQICTHFISIQNFREHLTLLFTQLRRTPKKDWLYFGVMEWQKYASARSISFFFFFKLKNPHTGQDQQYIIVPKNRSVTLGKFLILLSVKQVLYMCLLHCDQMMHIKRSIQCLAIDEKLILFFLLLISSCVTEDSIFFENF